MNLLLPSIAPTCTVWPQLAAAQRGVGGRGSVLNARNAAHVFDQLPFKLCFVLRLDVQCVETEVANRDATFAHARVERH